MTKSCNGFNIPLQKLVVSLLRQFCIRKVVDFSGLCVKPTFFFSFVGEGGQQHTANGQFFFFFLISFEAFNIFCKLSLI